MWRVALQISQHQRVKNPNIMYSSTFVGNNAAVIVHVVYTTILFLRHQTRTVTTMCGSLYLTLLRSRYTSPQAVITSRLAQKCGYFVAHRGLGVGIQVQVMRARHVLVRHALWKIVGNHRGERTKWQTRDPLCKIAKGQACVVFAQVLNADITLSVRALNRSS
jgi:hypothetical protein